MPPEGGNLFIDEGGGAGACISGQGGQVAFSPLPTEYEYEDNDSTCIAEHDQHTNALGSKLHWHDNILGTKPKPLQKLAFEHGCDSAVLACVRELHSRSKKHQIVLL